MKNTLTRSELLKAQKSYGCKIWIDAIQEILDSTNNENILIEDKYLDLIKEEATWEQILFCKSLNLDLKWNLPEEAKEWILEKLKACDVIKINDFRTLYKENGITLFVLNSVTEEILFDYYRIFQVLKKKYFFKCNEINELVNNIFE